MNNMVKAIARVILKIGLIIALFALSMTGKFDNVDFLRICRNVSTMLVLLSPVLYILLTGWTDDSKGLSFKAFSIIITEIFAVGLVLLVTAYCTVEEVSVAVVLLIVTCALRLVYSIVLEIAATSWENKTDSDCVRQVEWRTNQIAKVIFIYYNLANIFLICAPSMHPSDNALGDFLSQITFLFFYELILKFINWVTALPVTLRLKHYVKLNS